MPVSEQSVAAGPELNEKLEFLAQAWPGAERIETHTAFVFLVDDRVYKLKKPVVMEYLDYRSLAAREHICREEIRLNRQLAGDMYLDVTALVRDPQGRLALAGQGEVVDWLVVMRRLPRARFLDTCLRGDAGVTSAEIAAVTDRLITFYRDRQADSPNPGLYLRHLIRESAVNTRNLHQMRGQLGAVLDTALISEGAAMIAHNRAEISARDGARLIVEGHGDLRPEHVCLTAPPTLFDRLEFSVEMRMIDIFDEVNYLGLECAMLGAQWVAPQVLAAMRLGGFAPPSPALQTAYGVFRCLTRARLAIDHLRDPAPRTPEKWPRQARAYLARAAELLAGGG